MVITNILKSKRLIIIALIVSMSIFFFACGKGAAKKGADTPEPIVETTFNPLVGTWVTEVPDLGTTMELVLNANGTGGFGAMGFLADITWDATDTTITTIVDGVSATAPYTLDENTLTITTDEGTTTYTRK